MNKSEAITRAKKMSNNRGETIIVYEDKNEGFEGFDFTTESHWDFLVDTNYAEPNWIVCVIN